LAAVDHPSVLQVTSRRFNKFFSDKVAAVRSATDGANELSYRNIGADSSWSSLLELTTADVVTAIHQLPDKSSAVDPIPASVLKQIAVQITPFLTKLFGRSLITGHFLDIYKSAFITPLIKKAGMDVSVVHILPSPVCQWSPSCWKDLWCGS
jgi:hypothetical protein